MAKTYKISEVCGDWALHIPPYGKMDEEMILIFNSRNNAELVKSVLEWEDAHPNAAVPYMPTHTPPNEWVSVEERIPNFGKLVIATDGTTYGVAWLCSDCTWMVTMGYKSQSWFGRKITHWMPIPALPNHRPPEGEA